MTTPIDVRNRIMALAERIQLTTTPNPMHVYHTEEECSFSDDDLPAMVVKISPRERRFARRDTNRTHETTFTMLIALYVSHICDDSYGKDMDGQDEAELAAGEVIDYLAARPTLSMNYDNGIVDSAEIESMIGPHTMPTKGSNSKNRGVQLRMTVILRKVVTIDDE